MKSPWKFLAQFIPQRGSAEASENSIEQNSDIERSQTEARQTSGLPSNATEASRGSERDESRPTELKTSTSDQFEPEIGVPLAISVPDDVEALPAPARRRPNRPTARLHALPVESEPNKKSQRAPLTKKLVRAKSTDAVAQSVAVANRDRAARAASSRDAFFEEVASLDKDIEQLRIQLARKLHLQNDQLKKMLERFDVS